MKKIVKERILSPIILRYYRTPEKNDNKERSGINCAWCLDKNVVNIGGGFKDEKGNFHQICENCAVLRYKDDCGFRTLSAARARRRRIFDIGYLFNELVIDQYIKANGIKDISEIKTGLEDDIFLEATKLFNYLFSKEEKVKIEEIEKQKDIEAELLKRINTVDFQEYFRNLGIF
mgnify:FL=1